MSAQLRVASKANKRHPSVQESIGRFLKKPKTLPALGQCHNGRYVCGYCERYFKSLAGLKSHEQAHQANNDPLRTRKQRPPGRVKVNEEKMTSPERRAYRQELRQRGEHPANDTAAIEIDGDDDSPSTETSDRSVSRTNAMQDVAGRGEDNADSVEGGEESTNVRQGNCGGGGDDDGVSNNIVRQGNWTPRDIVKALDEYYQMKEQHGEQCKGIFIRHVQTSYGRPKYDRKTLNRWLNNEVEYRESAKLQKSDRRKQGIKRPAEGKYPEMEERLAARIRATRDVGMPVETWMLEMEGKLIFNEIWPWHYAKPTFDPELDKDLEYPIKFTNRWTLAFLQRHGFSYRKIGTKMNKKGKNEDMINDIREFHLRCRALQLSEMNDPKFGFTSPQFVYSHDQVPIELADQNEKTIETRGADAVYDAVSNDADTKRFCTLNLFGGMSVVDGVPYPRPHLVFRASKFQERSDWHDQEEASKWDERVVVSFQENAWVDTRTHIHGLKRVLGPINDHLEGSGLRGVTFEDNLSSHQTEATMNFWKDELKNFIRPHFVPARMTEIIQVIDRHIGILYKRAVYLAYRKEMMKRLREARANAGRTEGVVIQPLTPSEKRILICKAVADKHEELVKSGAYLRAFIATGTWMPVSHLVRDAEGDCNGLPTVPEESEVKLQHLDEYKYTEQCSREKVWAAIDEAKRKEDEERAERERMEAEEKAAVEAEKQRLQPFVARATFAMARIEELLSKTLADDLKLIHNKTGFEEFIIGGSWSSAKIADAVATIFKDDATVDPVTLIANDIDVYHGDFSRDSSKRLEVKLNCIAYEEVDELSLEVNTVECRNLSAESFLVNNDLNITATCFHVDVTKDKLFSVHALPCFWEFLFAKENNRLIRTVNTVNASEYGATTCIRMAFKAFEMGLKVDFGKVDPTVGTIAASQKAKWDKMKGWVDSPLHAEYQCNKSANHFVVGKKHTKTRCVSCTTGWANKNCSNKMCKKCCMKATAGRNPARCRVKDHQ